VTMRHAVTADLATAAESLAVAFVDDPMVSWVAGDRPPEQRLELTVPGFFAPALSAGMSRGHTYVASDLQSAAIWSPPDVPMFDETSGAAFGAAVVEHLGGDALQRLMALGELVDSHHPRAVPHFYLFILGAADQGRGAGAALLAPVLARCDSDGLPAYLESSNGRNVGFYERHGFEVQWEARPSDDGPMIRGMWRNPQG
jgi:GNAT superfamily N-acetyltransferase